MDYKKLKDILKYPTLDEETNLPILRKTRRVLIEQDEKSYKESFNQKIDKKDVIDKENSILESAILSAHKRGLKVKLNVDVQKKENYLKKLQEKKKEIQIKNQQRKLKNEQKRKRD